MSSCLSGRTYGYNLENIVKPSLSSSNSNSKSNSSTLSASSDSLMPVSTRKPRTTRKRPNQTYNEAVALLSTACPDIFTTTKKNNHSTLPFQHSYLFNNPTELLLPEKPIKAKPETPRENEFNGNLNWSPNSSSLEQGNHDDFDTESMLDEDIGEGIDSILGNPNSVVEKDDISNGKSCFSFDFNFNSYFNPCFGYPVGVGIGGNLECKFGFGLRNGVRAMKNVDEGDRWSFPVVDVTNILPPEATKTEKSQIGKNKKVMKMEPECLIIGEERSSVENGPRLMLTLSYDKVLKAWSETGSPVPESPRSDIQTKLAQIDLFSENGGVIEVSVVRYKEKRRTRFFSKKIRYHVRKVNADLQPRSEGRFVRRPNSPTCEEI